MQFWKFVVKGRVQGVGYRAFVGKLASKYKINGSAQNKIDGGVEVVFAMPADILEEIKVALKKGPAMSEVTAVSAEEIEAQELTNFSIF